MCKRLLVLLLVLCFVSSASATLVHNWEFDGNTNDTSGNGNHGTFSGDTAVYVPGIPGDPGGQALDFSDDTVDDLTTSGAARPAIGGSLLLLCLRHLVAGCLRAAQEIRRCARDGGRKTDYG